MPQSAGQGYAKETMTEKKFTKRMNCLTETDGDSPANRAAISMSAGRRSLEEAMVEKRFWKRMERPSETASRICWAIQSLGKSAPLAFGNARRSSPAC